MLRSVPRVLSLGLLLLGCGMDHAKEVGFLDRASRKDVRQSLERPLCPAGTQWVEEISCKGKPHCEGKCVDSEPVAK